MAAAAAVAGGEVAPSVDPSDRCAVAPPVDCGLVSPPVDCGLVSPPVDCGVVAPPVDRGVVAPSADPSATVVEGGSISCFCIIALNMRCLSFPVNNMSFGAVPASSDGRCKRCEYFHAK